MLSMKATLLFTCGILLLLIGVKANDSDCDKYSNTTCKDCVAVSGCHYCEPTKKCAAGSLVKSTLHKACEGQDWKVGQCIISGKVLIIALPVAGFVLLVIIGCTIYCCCCRKKKNNRGPGKEEAKWRHQREEIENKHKERRAERQKKHDEIRKKYGLFRKDDTEDAENGHYHRFDNTTVA